MLKMVSTRILLVDDCEVDYELTADLLSDIPARHYAVDWQSSCDNGLEALRSGAYDICLVDYSLGLKTSMDFLTAVQELRTKTPIIMLTGMKACEVDEKAQTLGAADFLIKDGPSPAHLERATRCAIERGRLLAELAHLTGHDSLTGLANRAHFYDFLTGAVARARRNKKSVVIMRIDLHDFKHINDSMGHTAGAQLLQCIASRVQEIVRRRDLAARLGGDEFVVALDNVTSDETATGITEKVITELCRPATLDGHTVHPRVSVGIARNRSSDAAPDSLIRAADSAVYQAKAKPDAAFQIDKPTLPRILRTGAASAGK